jgi:hypothetical protein
MIRCERSSQLSAISCQLRKKEIENIPRLAQGTTKKYIESRGDYVDNYSDS